MRNGAAGVEVKGMVGLGEVGVGGRGGWERGAGREKGDG